MIANQEPATRDGEALSQTGQDSTSVLVPAATSAISTETVLSAYKAAARRSGGGSAFAAAVDAYIACYPGTHPDAAARIVAEIICHRS